MADIKITQVANLTEHVDNLNTTLPYEYYSEVFTYSMSDLSQYKVGFEGEFAIAYIKNSVEHLFFIMETSCTDIVIKQLDFRHSQIPDQGIIFGLLLDGCIVRAVRENQLKQPGLTFRVLLIDFGEILEISKDDKMYMLPPKYRTIPGQAIFCKLTMDVNNCNDKNFLANILYTKQKIRIERILGNMLEVTVNPTGPSDWNAIGIPESPIFIAEKTSISDRHTKDGLTQEQIGDLCVKTNTGVKEAYCQLDHTTILKDGWTIDKLINKVTIHSKFPTPQVGKKINLLVTWVVDIDKFYGQIIPKNYKSAGDLTALKILNEMNACETKSTLKPFLESPDEFELVFAMYTDKLWYRAKILHKFSDARYKVFYVDYGNCSFVTLDQLRKWDDAFDCYPFQALEYKLDNVSKLRDNHKEAIECFERLVLCKLLKATVTYNIDCLHVTLKDAFGLDIGEHLCECNYAQQKPINKPAI